MVNDGRVQTTVLHGGHIAGGNCWSRRKSKICRMSYNFCCSTVCSARRRTLSVLTRWTWYDTYRNRFVSSRFSTLSRFTWFLRFSKCFCFRILDRLADSRFDSIRLRFRSSTTETGRFGSFGQAFGSVGLVLVSGSSEPEPEPDTTGLGD